MRSLAAKGPLPRFADPLRRGEGLVVQAPWAVKWEIAARGPSPLRRGSGNAGGEVPWLQAIIPGESGDGITPKPSASQSPPGTRLQGMTPAP